MSRTPTAAEGAISATNGRFPRRQAIQNILDGPEVWEAGDLIPSPPRQNGGAKRLYPGWMFVLFDVLIHEFGTAVAVTLELTDRQTWRMLQKAARARYPSDPTMWLRDEPMRLHHYNYMKRAYLTRREFLQELGDLHRRLAAELATQMGLCVRQPGESWTHPTLENTVYGDGKVIKARSRQPRLNRHTGEYRPGSEPDLEEYVTGGGMPAAGVGFVSLVTRSPEPNERVILDVIDAPRAGGEAAHAMKAFRRTLPLLPGAQATLCDGAMRGVHRREIFEMGKVPISPPRNRDNPKPHERYFGPVEVHGGGLTELDIQLVDGMPNIKELADDGTPVYTPLIRIKTSKPRKSGACYNEYVVPAEFGGGVIRLRVTSDDQDRASKFNREEWLHAFAPGDPDYERLYGRRNDAESGNASLDNSMPRERAHSVGRPGILMNLITWAFYKNAQARALHAQRAGPPAAAAA
jgi:hypothetical protein